MKRLCFDKVYIIDPINNQNEYLGSIHEKTDVEFIKDIKDSPSLDQLPKELRKLLIFDDVKAKE